MNDYWTQPTENPTKVDCPGCGEGVDIDGPLEDMHFVFAMRMCNGVLERSQLGTCPVNSGYIRAVSRMRFYLGVYQVYYRGELH